jgi:NTP pyrophosphatase (non-canonical NTP hydrolase)
MQKKRQRAKDRGRNHTDTEEEDAQDDAETALEAEPEDFERGTPPQTEPDAEDNDEDSYHGGDKGGKPAQVKAKLTAHKRGKLSTAEHTEIAEAKAAHEQHLQQIADRIGKPLRTVLYHAGLYMPGMREDSSWTVIRRYMKAQREAKKALGESVAGKFYLLFLT